MLKKAPAGELFAFQGGTFVKAATSNLINQGQYRIIWQERFERIF